MAGTRREVAEAIMALTYIEMMELAEVFANSVKIDREDGVDGIDFEDRDCVADRFRWWAEGDGDHGAACLRS